VAVIVAVNALNSQEEVVMAVVGQIHHFIFKALIFWQKVKVSLAFEN
jgi:hypothetical protein